MRKAICRSQKILPAICLILLATCQIIPVDAQQTSRNYNRFQYHRYHWKVLPVAAFHIYYPESYDSLCRFASLHLPDIIEEQKKLSGIELQQVPNFVIYPSVDQLYESNIGMREAKQQTFPTINLKGSRAVVAFDGSYEHFREQLSLAVMRLGWEELFKTGTKEQLTNRASLIPGWFKEGTIHYFAQGWPLTREQATQQLAAGTVESDWRSITEKEPDLSGQAFCYFLSVKYRKDAPRQILSQLRQGKSLSRAVRLVTKQNLDTLASQCIGFYRQRAISTEPQVADSEPAMDSPTDSLVRVLFSEQKLVTAMTSPEGKHTAVTVEDQDTRTVYLFSKEERGQLIPKKVYAYKMAPWISGHSADPYPVIAWDGSGYLYVSVPEKGKIQVKKYTATGQKADQRTLFGVDGLGILIPLQQDRWLLSAFRRGQSDIVAYQPSRSRYSALTSDQADNLEPYVNTQEPDKVLYRSGYPADSLYTPDSIAKDYGIYALQIVGTGNARDNQEQLLIKDSLPFQFGMPRANAGDQWLVRHNLDGWYREDVINPGAADQLWEQYGNSDQSHWLKEYLQRRKSVDSIAALKQRLAKEDVSLLGRILQPGDPKAEAAAQKDSMRRATAYHPKKTRPYLLSLYSSYFSASINNDYYINRYQPYKGYLGSFKFPEVGAMVQGGFSDLFENHHFNIGYRMPSGMEGSDFFFRYENTGRKLDWHLMYFRKVESLKPDPDRNWVDASGQPYPALAKVKTYYYELGFHYPLHYDWGLDFTVAARNDKTVFPATDRYSLNYENLHAWWNINSLALKADKLQPTIPMLYKGWQGSIMLDGFVSGGRDNTILYGSALKLSYHLPVYKHITFVVRAQAGHSGGGQKILYNFGGLDNNVVPRVDSSVQFTQQAPYAFQSLVTPFRGYRQNSIYGSSFALLNADLYVPLFRELIPLQTSFSMVNALQLGIFADLVTAGRTETDLPASPSHLYSYGLSARTMLAGYGLRFDIAWPENLSKQPVWYLSLIL